MRLCSLVEYYQRFGGTYILREYLDTRCFDSCRTLVESLREQSRGLIKMLNF
jgi:hypothetical protein